jgi:hypothetical protein
MGGYFWYRVSLPSQRKIGASFSFSLAEKLLPLLHIRITSSLVIYA